jgi:O-antigen/teichoic acid export membrane protein
MVDLAVGVLTIALYGRYYDAVVTTYHGESPDRKHRVMSTATLLQAGLAVIVVPIPMLLSPWLSQVLIGDSSYFPVLILALATVVVDLTGKAASTELLINRSSVVYSAVSILRLVMAISLNIALVLVLRVGLIGIFVSSFVSAATSAAIFVWIALRKNGTAFDRSIARRLLEFQLPLAPAELVGFSVRQLERVLVRFFIGLDGVGVLEMAYKFPPMLNWLIVGPFMMAWRTKSIEIGSHPDAPRSMGRMLTNVMFVMLLAGTILAVDVGPIITLLTPEPFWRAAVIARVEVVTTILAGLVTFMQFGLLYRKRTRKLAVIAISVAAGKAALSLFLIRKFGLGGAAYSALVTEAVTLTWLFRESQKAYAIDIEVSRILVLTGTAAALWATVIYTEKLTASPAVWFANTALVPLRQFFDGSPLATWHSGALKALGQDKLLPFATLIVNTAVASLFALTIFIVRPGAVREGFHGLLGGTWFAGRQPVPISEAVPAQPGDGSA